MLARQGLIRMRVKFEGQGVFAETEDRKIYYDVVDGFGIDNTALNDCDFYFKRSYFKDHVDQIAHGDKIRPLGLNYPVFPSSLDWHAVRRRVKLADSTITKVRRALGAVLLRRQKQLSVDNLHAAPKQQEPGVLFLTRTWEPDGSPLHGMPGREDINHMRAECIRLLREQFGKNCIAGFSVTPYAVNKYPKLLATVDTSKLHYLKMLKEFATVCVASTGLHGSIGWKFGEYVAFSKAIISEPLNYVVPDFYVDRNYQEFRTPKACVEAVQALLDDPERCMRMRRMNAAYYESHLRPDKLVANTLELAWT